jgi:hypothetical protein
MKKVTMVFAFAKVITLSLNVRAVACSGSNLP